jgi:hypothetical protein
MPSLATLTDNSTVKLLVVGDSGAGKTGGLSSLIDAGYKLRIIDFEEGIGTLAGYADPAKLDNVSYHQLKDEFRISGNQIAIKRAPAFQTYMGLLNDWKEPDGTSLGGIASWGPDTIFVLDTLGSCSKSSLNMVLQANNKLTGNPEIQHYGTAMDNVEKMLDMLTNSKLVPCHVIVLAHLAYVEEKDAKGQPFPSKAFPETIGNKLNPKVGRKFNNLISLSQQATGRSFKTKRDGLVMCKTERLINEKYPLETGLAEIFRDLKGKKSLGPEA